MRQISLIMENIVNPIRIPQACAHRWAIAPIHSIACLCALHRTQWATTKTINNGQEPCAKRNYKHQTAHQFRMWLKIKPKRKRYRKSDCGLLHAIQIRTRIPLRLELGYFLVPLAALCFGVLHHFLEHNRHSTTETAPSQHYEEKISSPCLLGDQWAGRL